MFARSLQKTTKETSKHYIGKRGIFYFDRDLQLVADSMRRNLGRSMRRGCNPFDFHRQNHYFVEPVYHQPNRSTYEKKTIINDEDGRIVVKTVRKTPGRPWETHVEEYFNKEALEQGKNSEAQTQGKKAETANKYTESRTSNTAHQARKEQSGTQQQQTVERTNNNQQTQKTEAADHNNRRQVPTENAARRHPAHYHERDVFSQFDREFREMSNAFTRDFDSFFGRGFNPRSFFEGDSSFAEGPQYTNYTSKTILNDNGNVTVKTTRKNSDNQWETRVETYDTKGDKIEGDKKADMSAEAKKDSQNLAENLTNNQSSDYRSQGLAENSANQ